MQNVELKMKNGTGCMKHIRPPDAFLGQPVSVASVSSCSKIRVNSSKRTQIPKAFQGCYQVLPNLSKVLQAFPSHFQNKKDCLAFMSHIPKIILVERRLLVRCSKFESVFISVHPWLESFSLAKGPANSKRKSTVAYPKSTLDLREEKLIWVKKWPVHAILPGSHRLFSQITTRKWNRANQNPTESDQKAKAPALDLDHTFANHHQRMPLSPCWTKSPFYSSIVHMASPSKAAGNNNPANPLPFEDALKKLEGIVEAMEADDLPLE